MGEVYLAQDTKLDRKVAIKFLNEEFSKDVDKLNRFIQEAKAVSALNHPNILTVYEIGEKDEANFIVTEFIEVGFPRVEFTEALNLPGPDQSEPQATGSILRGKSTVAAWAERIDSRAPRYGA